jgi:AcrR family transcriptional regulator
VTAQKRRLPTRKDAVENRERLLSGAEAYFAERGIDAPLHGLASQVGVGIGTLYRNFSSQEELIRALYDRCIARFDSIVAAALAKPTGWEGVVELLTLWGTDHLAHPEAPAIMRRQAASDPEYRPAMVFIEPLALLVDRAKAEGKLRPDVGPGDLSALPFGLGALQHFPVEFRARVAARQLAIMIDGIRAESASRDPLPFSITNPSEFHDGIHR